MSPRYGEMNETRTLEENRSSRVEDKSHRLRTRGGEGREGALPATIAQLA